METWEIIVSIVAPAALTLGVYFLGVLTGRSMEREATRREAAALETPTTEAGPSWTPHRPDFEVVKHPEEGGAARLRCKTCGLESPPLSTAYAVRFRHGSDTLSFAPQISEE